LPNPISVKAKKIWMVNAHPKKYQDYIFKKIKQRIKKKETEAPTLSDQKK